MKFTCTKDMYYWHSFHIFSCIFSIPEAEQSKYLSIKSVRKHICLFWNTLEKVTTLSFYTKFTCSPRADEDHPMLQHTRVPFSVRTGIWLWIKFCNDLPTPLMTNHFLTPSLKKTTIQIPWHQKVLKMD